MLLGSDGISYRGRATAFHERFFAYGETAFAPLPALIRLRFCFCHIGNHESLEITN